MGRHPIAKEKKRELIGASVEKRIVDELGLLVCKEIAENAVIKEYYKKGISGIYKITNPIGKSYIGGSKNVDRRINNHKKSQMINHKLQSSYEVFGVENHTFEVIEECPLLELSQKENYYQLLYNSVEDGLNIILTKPESKRNFE